MSQQNSSTQRKGPQRRNFQGSNQNKNSRNAPAVAIQDPQLRALINSETTKQYVVNVRKATPDVYVGRRNPLCPAEQCYNYKYGNPFKMDGEEAREQCCLDFWHYMESNPQLVDSAKRELQGKKLGCWCYPLACHAMVLAEFANE